MVNSAAVTRSTEGMELVEGEEGMVVVEEEVGVRPSLMLERTSRSSSGPLSGERESALLCV